MRSVAKTLQYILVAVFIVMTIFSLAPYPKTASYEVSENGANYSPLMLHLEGSTSSESNYTIPDIDSSMQPNPALNIGPGAPWIVFTVPASYTIILKEPVEDNITAVYLNTARITKSGVEIVRYPIDYEVVNSTAINVSLPPVQGYVPSGLYDLVILTSSGKLFIPRSVWIMDPNSLIDYFKFVHITDVHFGAGTPNIEIGQNRRFVGYLFGQLVGVDALLNTGDEADTQASTQYVNSLSYRYAFAYTIPEILAPGNHDFPNKNFIKYYEKTVNYFLIGDKILVVTLNTDGENGYADQANLTALQTILEEYKDVPYKFIMMHHPVFYYQGEVAACSNTTDPIISNPRQNSESAISYYWGSNMNATREFLHLVEEYNVTMVLAGHIHRDQYVIYNSTCTGTTTYFQTTTTLAHGTGTYQGLQVVWFNLTDGKPEYPYVWKHFVGYNKTDRRAVYNSIPITRPEYSENWQNSFGNEHFYGFLVKGDTALILELENYMETLDINNKTILLALPWPAYKSVNLKVLDAENSSVDLHGYAYDNFSERTIVALNVTLHKNSKLLFALYTQPDNIAPEITLKTTIPRNPAVNKLVKAYVKVSDEGWGVKDVDISASAQYGNLTVFQYSKYSSDTYLVKFKVEGNAGAKLILHVTASDWAGNTNVENLTINLAPPSTSTTTTPSTSTPSTSPQSTAAPSTSSTSPTTTSQSTSPTGGGLSTTAVVTTIIVIIVIIAAIYYIRK